MQLIEMKGSSDNEGSGKVPTVFVDRDGTIIKDKHYLSDPTEVEFCEGAVEGLKRLCEAGFSIVVVTNQSGIARGYFSVREMQAVHDHIVSRLKDVDVDIECFLYCPHGPDDDCPCRKPAPGLIIEYFSNRQVDMHKSWFIGDRLCDMQLAQTTSIPGIWIKNHRHPQEILEVKKLAHSTVRNFSEAACCIVSC